jgi:hypothetical protein
MGRVSCVDGCQHGIIVSSTCLNLRSVSLVHVAICTLRRLSSLLYASHARVLVATQQTREATLSHRRDTQNELSTKLCVRVCGLTLSKHAHVHAASATRHASAIPTLATMTHAQAHSAQHARAHVRRLGTPSPASLSAWCALTHGEAACGGGGRHQTHT